ncbi:hypothetical protein [Streptomyces sp. NPDC101150]|uniref:hypothetical protein n=1 Tax=Streptomyces sp. NPDC101150 TaxID=3366114 RepID=UPI00382644D9
MSTVTTGAIEQVEELLKALREGSESKVKQALAKGLQDPKPGGQQVDIERLIHSAAPQELKDIIGVGQKAAGGAADTLGNVTKPFQAWEAEPPHITMMLGSLMRKMGGIGGVVSKLGSALGIGGGGGEQAPERITNQEAQN